MVIPTSFVGTIDFCFFQYENLQKYTQLGKEYLDRYSTVKIKFSDETKSVSILDHGCLMGYTDVSSNKQDKINYTSVMNNKTDD